MPTLIKECCPSCGQPEGVPLIRGMPGKELWEAKERGDVTLGGCDIEDDESGDIPNMKCLMCGHS